MNKLKKGIANVILIVSVLLIIGVVIYGLTHKEEKRPVFGGGKYLDEEEEVYYLGEHELAEFSDVIVEQFNQESKLVVYSVDASVSVDLKQTGIFDLAVLNKTQKVIYRGNSEFYVDLSMLGAHSIHLDNKNSVITIEIPHTEFAGIEIDPNQFSFEEAQKGLLAFGQLKFTAQEYNNLETECKRKMQASLDTAENRKKADERAIEEMMKVYEPIVKAVDDSYSVEIVFIK